MVDQWDMKEGSRGIRDAIESVMPQTGVLQPYAYQLILVRHSTAV